MSYARAVLVAGGVTYRRLGMSEAGRLCRRAPSNRIGCTVCIACCLGQDQTRLPDLCDRSG